jgi:hypothetical protein
VDERDNSERIEIELTPVDETRGWGRRASTDTPSAATDPLSGGTWIGAGTEIPGEGAFAEPVPLSGGPLSTERRRLGVTALGVAALALLVGWAIGRTGSDAPTAVEDEPAISTTTEETAPPSTIEAVGSTPPTVGPRRASTTTSTIPSWTLSSIELDPRAAALDIRIVGVADGKVFEIDTGAGEVATLDVRATYNQPPFVDAGEDWILIRSTDSSDARLLRGRDAPVNVTLGDPWSSWRQEGTERFWKTSQFYNDGQPTQIAEVDHEGNATGVFFELLPRQWVQGVDPAGGVVVAAPGGTYSAGPDGSYRITSGQVLALNAQIALIAECGDDLDTCGTYLLDRARGTATPITITAPDALGTDVPIPYEGAGSWGTPQLLSAISPDGRWAPLIRTDARQGFGLVDLTTGRFVQLAAFPESGLWWSPDGRSAIYLRNQRLAMFDAVEGVTFDIAVGLPVGAFSVRPAD